MMIFRYLVLFIIFLLLMGKVTIASLSLETSGEGLALEYVFPCDWSEEPIEADDSMEGDEEVLTNFHPLLSSRMVNLVQHNEYAPGLQTSPKEIIVPPPQV